MVYYGMFKETVETADFPVFPLSTDPGHMVEFAGYGFPVAGVIAPYRTTLLQHIDEETDTVVCAYSDVLRRQAATGTSYALPMSEEELSGKAFGRPEESSGEDTIPIHNQFDAWYRGLVEEEIQDTADEHGEVGVYPYMQSSALQQGVLQQPEVEVIAPPRDVVTQLRDKTAVYEALQDESGVNTVPGTVVDSPWDAYGVVDAADWENGAFISAEGGAAGSGCLHASEPEEVIHRFQPEHFEGRLIVQPFLPVEKAPNVLLLIDEEQPHVLAYSEQIIEDETAYYGNRFHPDIFTAEEEQQIQEQAERVGEYMHREGFRGIAGVDLLISNGDTRFVEINPRKNHSTVVKNAWLERTRPDDIPPLPRIEAEILRGEDPGYALGGWEMPRTSWEMYLVKKQGWSRLEHVSRRNGGADHEWDFTGGFIANIPHPLGAVSPKSYASQKAEGHTRSITPNELARVVAADADTRERLVEEVEACFTVRDGGNRL